ncbi:MAG TPA: HD domain-containing protein [Candidatus Acidoferrales bacterium]|nr:HD domain-containing protein [Candidatus Acidoferrales bacterium]
MPGQKPSLQSSAKSTAGPKLTGRFIRALGYSARVHAHQMRKGKDRPYIGHLLGVASIVIEHGGDEDQAIAALLHDAVEDQGGRPRLEEIRRKFGSRVARMVDGCTDAYSDPKPEWHARKKAYVERIRREPAEIQLISAADKLHNAREVLADFRLVGDAVWSRFKGGKEGTLQYYRQMVDALSESGRTPLVDELARVVSKLERLANPASTDPEPMNSGKN